MAKFKFKGRTRYGKRHTPGVMNVTEGMYAEILQAKKLAGLIEEWLFEDVTLRLANRCTYTPDFYVRWSEGRIEFVDTKGTGPIDEKSIVKIKAAAAKWPEFDFSIEKLQAKKDGGGFRKTEY